MNLATPISATSNTCIRLEPMTEPTNPKVLEAFAKCEQVYAGQLNTLLGCFAHPISEFDEGANKEMAGAEDWKLWSGALIKMSEFHTKLKENLPKIDMGGIKLVNP